ncbi:MAG: biotin/lipoyl-containing protein, partial [Planctomycetota bacterium]
MIKELLLPKLGQTMEVATIENWVKNEGDEVNKGEVVLEITTDKATLEVESYQRGVLLKTFAEAGMLLPVNTPIAIVGKPDDEIPDDVVKKIESAIQKGLVRAEKIASGEIVPGEDEDADQATEAEPAKADAPAPEPSAPETPAVEAPAKPAPAPAAAPKPAGSSVVGWRAQVLKERPSHILSSPRARKLASDKKIRLEQIAPSGPGGRIVEKDVAALADRLTADRISPLALAEAYDKRVDLVTLLEKVEGKITEEHLDGAAVFGQAPTAEDKAVRLTPMRRIVAERLGQSKREIPHYYLRATCNMSRLVTLRGELNRSSGTKH